MKIKMFNMSNIIAGVLAFSFLMVSPKLAEAEPQLDQILQIAYKAKGPETLEAQMTMALIDSGGKSTERSLEIRREGDNKQLVWFTAPANMRGTGFLRVVENGTEKMWLYLPAFKKLERIGATDKKRSFLGSDFTYADMGQHDLNQYNHKLLGKGKLDGVEVYHIEFNLKSMQYDVLYSKIISYVRASDSRILREDLYDKKGELIKQKSHTKIENIGTYAIPTVIEMKDVPRNHITRLTLRNVEVDGKIPSRVFSTKYLQKIN